MAGIFQGLELAKRALLSHQFSLTTAGHNIANASTPGYSRQRLQLTATDPLYSTIGPLGTGTRVAWVRQQRDLFLTGQYRQASDQMGRWQTMERSLTQVENVFQEPTDLGLNTVINDFFASWHTLSQNPESSAARASVRENAATLTNTFHQLSRRLTNLEQSLDKEVNDKVAYINQTASEIAGLNREIGRAELDGKMANDLRDRRDLLIDQLSGVVNVNVMENSKGHARVFIGSMEIVGGTGFNPLATQTVKSGNMIHETIVWKNSTVAVPLTGGELSGILESRDSFVPAYRSMLDELAAAIVTEVNGVHSTGYALDGTTGYNFFDPNGTTAASMEVDTGILGNVNRIAASQSGAVGDNANALAIADLQDALALNGGTATFNDFYSQLVSGVGRDTADAIDANANSQLIVQQIEFSRQSVQGVSLDEEMAEMIKAQHAYEAAARVVATIDSTLNTLINDMGVGR